MPSTGRDLVLGAGYFGWLDWCSTGAGVPRSGARLFATIPFNDAERTRAAIRAAGDALACVVVEPVIEAEPSPEWLQRPPRGDPTGGRAPRLRRDQDRACAWRPGGAAARWGGEPDLVVLGKALANGFPLSAVGGPRRDHARSRATPGFLRTTATEFVSLAAARATLRVASARGLPSTSPGASAPGCTCGPEPAPPRRIPPWSTGVGGIPEMCYLRFVDERLSSRVAVACARRGLLFKRIGVQLRLPGAPGRGRGRGARRSWSRPWRR